MKDVASLFTTMGDLHCSRFIAGDLYTRETVNHLSRTIKTNKTKLMYRLIEFTAAGKGMRTTHHVIMKSIVQVNVHYTYC